MTEAGPRHLVVGVIGHVDHGKTALVRCLTGTETDRLREERERGISIALGFAHFAPAAGIAIDLIDMPGHERFVRTMVGGATGIDAVLLVVAANEGIRPQTVEHVAIAGLLGIRRAVVAVTKSDLVAPEAAVRCSAEAVVLLADNGLSAGPAVLTSAANGHGMDLLGAALADLVAFAVPRPSDGAPFLPIDRAFTVPGHGTVVTGTLRGAEIGVGATLDLMPSRRRAPVRGLQVHGQSVTVARPGQRVAVNLRGVEIGQVARGMALAAPGSAEPCAWFTLALRATDDAPPLRNGARLRALAGTAETDARLRLLDADVLHPGETALAQVRLAEPLALPVGEHCVLRLPAPLGTVAGGRVIEASARRLKRRDAAVLERAALLRDGPVETILAAETARNGPAGTTLAHLAQLTAISTARVAELLQALPVEVQKSGGVLPRGESERRKRLVMPDRSGERAAEASALTARIAQTMQQAGLTPPTPRELVTDGLIDNAVERLLRDGVLVRATDRAKGKSLLFHRDAVACAKATLGPLLGGEGLLVSEIAAALGISRKFCMPLLDLLDTTRFTRRCGDRRVLHDQT